MSETSVVLDVANDRAAQRALREYLRARGTLTRYAKDPSPDPDKPLRHALAAHMREWVVVASDGERVAFLTYDGTPHLDYEIENGGGDFFVREFVGDGLRAGLWVVSGVLHTERDSFSGEWDTTFDAVEERLMDRNDAEMLGWIEPAEWRSYIDSEETTLDLAIVSLAADTQFAE